MDVLQNQKDDAEAAAAAVDSNTVAVHHRASYAAEDKSNESGAVVSTASGSKQVGLEEFVDQELVHFSRADNVRSIPNVIDGLKPSQRKVLYSCFKRNLMDEVKVAQLAGYISEQTAYVTHPPSTTFLVDSGTHWWGAP